MRRNGLRRPLMSALVVALVGLCVPLNVFAQDNAQNDAQTDQEPSEVLVEVPDSMSAPLASELAEILSSRQLDAVAARYTEGNETDRFVAALAFPGQLLVVSARYAVPVYVVQKIDGGLYRDVYIDLNSASIADTKVLITDSGADGLIARSDTIDLYDSGTDVVRFDGDRSGRELSQDDYNEAFSEADAEYSRLLKALIAQVR